MTGLRFAGDEIHTFRFPDRRAEQVTRLTSGSKSTVDRDLDYEYEKISSAGRDWNVILAAREYPLCSECFGE